MATAREEIEMALKGEGSLGKASADEPVFILRAQDILAPILVRLWADLARNVGSPEEKYTEAEDLASRMDMWETKKWPD